MSKRGALIVLEGCDRSGKSSQCKNILEYLKKSGTPSEVMNFPDRTTETGTLIDSYLKNTAELPNEAVHLLFTANRWESRRKMEGKLLNGITLIVDRYSFSGVAYSFAKQNALDLDWYKSPERGLLKPDMVLFLYLEPEVIRKRKGFGEERYEKSEFQEAVNKCFHMLKDETWKVIDADTTVENLTTKLINEIIPVVTKAKDLPLSNLW